MSKSGENVTANVPLRESYQPADLLRRGYQPKLQTGEIPQPPHVGSSVVTPVVTNAPANQGSKGKDK